MGLRVCAVGSRARLPSVRCPHGKHTGIYDIEHFCNLSLWIQFLLQRWCNPLNQSKVHMHYRLFFHFTTPKFYTMDVKILKISQKESVCVFTLTSVTFDWFSLNPPCIIKILDLFKKNLVRHTVYCTHVV